DGRAAEGAPLLREYGVNSSIEGSNPSLSAIKKRVLNRAPFFLWRRERLDSNPSFERNAVTPTPQRSVGAPKG
ncbi:MAG: hypothetical protein N0C86_02000, partial [Candidatus Thiodiazotropha taylori]|nr:hypothetical protein [Candidatus Thiodiazotropha taylori]MCW4324748.1 hypothetical protein [Candidatus Thiodiazotropha taylori]